MIIALWITVGVLVLALIGLFWLYDEGHTDRNQLANFL